MRGDEHSLEHFDGVARLFPLPNLVFFPHVIQPLHIFEPRYRQMTADALGGDRLIALVHLREGASPVADAPGSQLELKPPAIHAVACLGKIVADQRLPDGRFHLLLRGLSRIRILQELPGSNLYRTAKVKLLSDRATSSPQAEAELRRALVQQVPLWFPAKGPALEQFEKLLGSDLTLSALCDIFSFALPLPLPLKQAMLEQLDVAERTRALLAYMKEHGPLHERPFPPDFSSN